VGGSPGNDPGSFLNVSKFHLSPAAASEVLRRYPSGIIPLPLSPKDRGLLKEFSQSGGYIVELVQSPVAQAGGGRNGVSRLSFKAKSKEANKQRQDLMAVHEVFGDELKSINVNSGIKREFYNVFNGVSLRNVSIEDIIRVSNIEDVKTVYPLNTYHVLLYDSLPMIGATDAWMMQDSQGRNITGKGVKIAVVDTGVDYTHQDLGGCTAQEIDGSTITVIGADYSLASGHPYADNSNVSWNITVPGYERIAVHFSNISLEDGFDVLYVRNSSGDVVQELTGSLADVWSYAVSGDTIYLNLVSDDSVTDWGFSVDEVINGTTDFAAAGCSKVVSGYDYVDDDNNPMDDYGHGTHCAATAAGNGALKGVAPDAKILSYKVCDSSGSCSQDDMMAAIDRAVYDGADVISMSIGGQGDVDDALSQSVDNAVDAGVVVVLAAGNSGPDNNTIECPGCARKAIAVGAVYKPNDPVRNRNSDLTVLGSSPRNIESTAFAYSALTGTGGIETGLIDAGIGFPEDYSGKNPAGKIAVIKQRTDRINYSDQVDNAYKAGCMGAIIYDSIDEDVIDDSTLTLGNLSAIPAAYVKKSDGEYLKELAESSGQVRMSINVDPVLVADFSSRGPFGIYNKPDVVAPGVNICAARMGIAFADSTLCLDNKHVLLSGTSMATPHVAGAAALLLQKYPDWLPLEVKAALENTATDYGYSRNVQGAGLINISAALELTSPPPVAYLSNISTVEYRNLKSVIDIIQ
jgi:subtilisin family serine protease